MAFEGEHHINGSSPTAGGGGISGLQKIPTAASRRACKGRSLVLWSKALSILIMLVRREHLLEEGWCRLNHGRGIFYPFEEEHTRNISASYQHHILPTRGRKGSSNEKEGATTASGVRVTQETCAEGGNTWWSIFGHVFCWLSSFSSCWGNVCPQVSIVCMSDQR